MCEESADDDAVTLQECRCSQASGWYRSSSLASEPIKQACCSGALVRAERSTLAQNGRRSVSVQGGAGGRFTGGQNSLLEAFHRVVFYDRHAPHHWR